MRERERVLVCTVMCTNNFIFFDQMTSIDKSASSHQRYFTQLSVSISRNCNPQKRNGAEKTVRPIQGRALINTARWSACLVTDLARGLWEMSPSWHSSPQEKKRNRTSTGGLKNIYRITPASTICKLIKPKQAWNQKEFRLIPIGQTSH